LPPSDGAAGSVTPMWCPAARISFMAATLLRVVAISLFPLGVVSGSSAVAGEQARYVASELLIALGDVRRLEDAGLPPRHREGVTQRIEGALGVLPWLLIRVGDPDGAASVAGWSGDRLRRDAARADLDDLLSGLSERHPLALARRTQIPQPTAALQEAEAIHQTYCAACHDRAGNGDPEALLPSRELRRMAGEEPGEIFLARLISGIKGDEGIAFRNPMTDRQLLALWAYYRGGPD